VRIAQYALAGWVVGIVVVDDTKGRRGQSRSSSPSTILFKATRPWFTAPYSYLKLYNQTSQ
jgi:hypothetical protein